MSTLPNIVLCLCDQLRAFEVGSYGNPAIRTPHIDRLAARGVRFAQAVTNNPVCMPARSCLLSGQYSRTCMGMLDNYAAPGPGGRMTLPEYPVQERCHFPGPTLPEQLKRLDYETALFGKWHIHPAPGVVGFDYSLFPRVHHRHTGQTFIENTGMGSVVDGFSVEFEAERVAAYLGTRRGDRPFFLYYCISPPHMPLMDAPQQYLTMYDPAEIPLRPNVFVDGQLPFDARWFRIYLWDFLFYEHHLPHTETLPEDFDLSALIALYYGMTTWVDDTVGRLMDALEKNGLSDNTIVVFLSDHGDNLGSHHRFNKGLLIEESIRIPLIFHAPWRWTPRVVAGQVAGIIDVMPTLLDLCGGEIPGGVQGRSLARLLSGEQDALEDTDAVIETAAGQIGLRTPEYLFGVQLTDDRQTIAAEPAWFYDLKADPYELHNRAQDMEEGMKRAMRERLKAWNEQTPWLGA
jgi:choline-sulfatase